MVLNAQAICVKNIREEVNKFITVSLVKIREHEYIVIVNEIDLYNQSAQQITHENFNGNGKEARMFYKTEIKRIRDLND